MLTRRYLLLLMCCLWKCWGEGGGGVIEEGHHLCHVTLTKMVMLRAPPGPSPATPVHHPRPPHQIRQCWPFWRCYVVLWTNNYSRWNPWSREHIEGKLSPNSIHGGTGDFPPRLLNITKNIPCGKGLPEFLYNHLIIISWFHQVYKCYWEITRLECINHSLVHGFN